MTFIKINKHHGISYPKIKVPWKIEVGSKFEVAGKLAKSKL
jgi:hypothetical protein